MHEYKVNILKVVDGDTVDVDIDLGFGVWLRKERVRIMGIDTPESRTSDKTEKIFGLLAKERLSSLLGAEAILQKQVSKKGEDMKGKFGRVLGNFITIDGKRCADILVEERHAVYYTGGSKEAIQTQHLQNRQQLIMEGKVIIPGLYDGVTELPEKASEEQKSNMAGELAEISDKMKADMAAKVTKPAAIQKEYVPEANDAPIVKTAKPKAKKTAKKKTAKKK